MSYVQESLMRGETIVYQGRVSMWSQGPRITASTFLMVFGVWGVASDAMGLGVISFLFGALMFGMAMIAHLTTELALTNRRVVAKFGVIRRRTVELNLAKVESVQVNQGLIGRMFNYGSLIVAGAGLPSAPIPEISQPMEFRRALYASLDSNEDKPALKLVA